MVFVFSVQGGRILERVVKILYKILIQEITQFGERSRFKQIIKGGLDEPAKKGVGG
jgi:hypothetical protein